MNPREYNEPAVTANRAFGRVQIRQKFRALAAEYSIPESVLDGRLIVPQASLPPFRIYTGDLYDRERAQVLREDRFRFRAAAGIVRPVTGAGVA